MLERKWTYVFHSFFDHARGYRGLALTQREGMEPIWHPRVLSKLQQGAGRILWEKMKTD